MRARLTATIQLGFSTDVTSTGRKKPVLTKTYPKGTEFNHDASAMYQLINGDPVYVEAGEYEIINGNTIDQ